MTNLSRLKQYLSDKPGALFIVGFLIFFTTAAVLLALRNANDSNEIAIYGFYALVVGIAVEIVVLLWKAENDCRKRHNHSAPSA